MGKQLSLFNSSTPMLTPKHGSEPYTGTGEPGAPYFGGLCNRNKEQIKTIHSLTKNNGGFASNPKVLEDSDMKRLVRRNIIGQSSRSSVYLVSEEQRSEMNKYLNKE